MQHKLIGFIGGGNMAKAIIFGLLKKGYPANRIIVSDPDREKLAIYAEQGIEITENNKKAAECAEVVLLAVKPQIIATVCEQLSAVDFSNKLLISIVAAISVDRFSFLLPTAKNIVRVMPNTPALVSSGMAGLFAKANVTVEMKNFAQDLLNSVGESCWVDDEEKMHAVTAVQVVVQPISFY